jgi:pantoate--beta-alanine ligase
MIVLKTVDEVARWREGVGGACVLVPTMGALHAGHAALVRQGAATGGVGVPVLVSVFVNPTQFNDPADFARYPKTLDADVALCAEAGARAIWAPGVEDVYPPGREVAVGVGVGVGDLPAVATTPGLEDAHRPGHFAGVCQVVRRLFDVVRPRAAVFGEKDWQQLAVVRAMVAMDREAGVERPDIVAGVTVREPDGLAMSSRNRFLTAADRVRGLSLSRALARAASIADPGAAESAMRETLRAAGVEPEYAVVRDAATLLAPVLGRPVRRLIAAKVGGVGAVRLIDNA